MRVVSAAASSNRNAIDLRLGLPGSVFRDWYHSTLRRYTKTFLLGRIAVPRACVYACGLSLQTKYSVHDVSACRSVTIVSPAKTAEAIEMPFGLWTRVGSSNHALVSR